MGTSTTTPNALPQHQAGHTNAIVYCNGDILMSMKERKHTKSAIDSYGLLHFQETAKSMGFDLAPRAA